MEQDFHKCFDHDSTTMLQVLLTAALLPYLGFILGGLVAFVCRLPRQHVLTVAIAVLHIRRRFCQPHKPLPPVGEDHYLGDYDMKEMVPTD